MRFFRAVALGAVVCGVVLFGAQRGVAAEPMLQPGDEGPAVAVWQRSLNVWLRASGGREIPVTAIFGDRTLAATEALEAAAGLPVNGIVSDRTRAALEDQILPAQYRKYEWPVPLPQWFWSWTQWYLHQGTYREETPFRGAASRPAAAPQAVPDWAWRRLAGFLHRNEIARARAFVHDRLENRYGAGAIDIRSVLRSRRDPSWIRVTGVYGEPNHRIWAVWLKLRKPFDRWYIQYEALDAAAVQPDPESVRSAIPCDIRPAFATPRC